MTEPIRPRPAIERMPSEFGIREGRGKFLRLDYNENTIGCSRAVQRALARLKPEFIAKYPEYTETRKRLAKFLRVDADQIVLSNGADESLRLVFDAFLDRGQTVFVVDPTFTMYRVYAGLYESRVISLRYGLTSGFPLKDACRVLRDERPRAFFLANPNNPTGTLLSVAEIERLLASAPETLVVVDEAYFDFCGVTVLPLLSQYPNLAVIRTFSKANGLAALRLGLTIAHPQIAIALRKAQPPFPVNSAAIIAAEAALKDTAYVRKIAREITASRKLLEAFFRARRIPFWPSVTNFLLADFGSGAPEILRALERKRILLRDRTPDFGRPGWVRITVGSRAQMQRLLRALKELL